MEPLTDAIERTVWVHEIPDFSDPHVRAHRKLDWSKGMTVADAAPAAWRSGPLVFAVNGELAPSLPGRPLAPGDSVIVIRAPADPATVFWIVWTALALYSVYNLLHPPTVPRAAQNNADPVYGWSPIRTNYDAAGMPLPIQYGEIRQGGAVVQEFTQTFDGDPPVSYINILLAIASGPIQSIGQYDTDQDGLTGSALPDGLLIEGNPAKNYSDVTCSLRLGSLDQTAIPDFDHVVTEIAVGLLVDQVTVKSGSTPVTDWSKAAKLDMPGGQTADRAIVGLLFPNGLVTFATDGSMTARSVDVQVRYTELDDGGTPIGNAIVAFFGDSQTLTLKAKQANSFGVDLQVPFYDPATFTPPVLSNALRFVRASFHQGQADGPPAQEPGWTTGAPITALSVFAFVTVRASHTTNPLWCMSKNAVIADPSKGIRVELRQGTAAGVSDVWVQIGDAAGGTATLSTTGDLIDDGTPHFLAVTYAKGGGAGGSNHLVIYVDGQAVAQLDTAITLAAVSGTSAFLWGAVAGNLAAADATKHADIDLDEFRVYSALKTADDIAAAHAAGAWTSGSPNETGLVLGYHNDQKVGNVSPSYLPGTADMTLVAPGGSLTTLIAVAGAVTNIFDNKIKRARYRVEVQRLTAVAESTSKHDKLMFDKLDAILDDALSYPGTALLALRIKASGQLSGSQPQITLLAKGRRDLPAWDGINPASPTFTTGYSANPAHCLAHLLLDSVNGGGAYFDVTAIDWPSFKAWADACATWVYDQLGTFAATQLAYSVPTTGWDNGIYKLRMATPQAPHFIVGKSIRVSALDAGALSEGFVDGVLTIKQVVSISSAAYEVWCDWPDGVAAPTIVPYTPAAGAVDGVEPRHECNIFLGERDLPFWDAVQQIAATGRAAVMRLGDKLRIAYDGPRSPVALFNAANIKADTLRISTTRPEDSFNAAIAEIQDKALDYERNQVPREHPSLEQDSSTAKVRRRVFDLKGTTKQSEAIRRLDYELARNHDVLLTCEFECGLDAAFVEPGDVFILAHPVARFNFGGRCLQDSVLDTELFVDIPVLVGSRNLLGKTGALSDGLWQRTGGTPPTLTSSSEPAPDGSATACVFTFAPGGASVLRQARALPNAVALVGSIYAKVKDAGGTITVNLNVDAGATSSAVPDDGGWHRVSAALVSGTADRFDVELAAGGGNRSLALTWAQLERGTAATDYAAVDAAVDPGTYSAAVKNTDTDAIAFQPLAPEEGGQYQPGDRISVTTSLGFVPLKNAPFAVGPVSTGSTTFSIVDTSLTTDFTRRIQGVQYVASIYPADDDYPALPASLALSSPTGTIGSRPTTMPAALDVPVVAFEESYVDPNTGALVRSIAVSWRHDPATADRVDRTLVWIAEQGSAEPAHQVGEVRGQGTFFRIVEGPGLRLVSGTSYRIEVQPITRGRARRARTRSATILLAGYFPVPQGAPASGAVTLHGDQATYSVVLPARFQNCAVEFWRGSPFIGQLIARCPVGTDRVGPTYDWSELPANADGIGNVPIVARLVSPAGARGDYVRVASSLAPTGFGAPLLQASAEDGPWDTTPAGFSVAPVLTGLALTGPAPGRTLQRLAFSGSGLTGSYETTVFDLAVARRVHVSAGYSGAQVAPTGFSSFPSLEAPSMRSWTPQGYTDPNHPDFGAVAVELQWAYSADSGDPGTDYQPFRPGIAFVRSCRFRLAVTRPTADFDVLLDRLGVAMRPMLSDAVDAPGGAGAPEGIVFGNATDVSYVISHGLGTRDLCWAVVENAAPYEVVELTIAATTVDSVTITVSSPPGVDALRLVLLSEVTSKAVIPFGDGASTTLTVPHQLSTRSLLYRIRQASAPYEFVEAAVKATSTEYVVIDVRAAPALNALVLIAVAAALGKVSVTFGDASGTSFPIPTGLRSRAIVPQVRNAATPYEFVGATIAATDDDDVTVTVSSAPGSNALLLAVVG